MVKFNIFVRCKHCNARFRAKTMARKYCDTCNNKRYGYKK